nr:YdcF family protein [Waterburya agarophytonicola]
MISISSIIPLRIAIARYRSPQPQAILTLGGGHQREVLTAEFATLHPQLPIWVSTGSEEMRAREIFHSMGVDNLRVYIDRRATDTVTNFTTLVGDFQKQNIQHIYLITDDFHLPRAKVIAFIVLGSRGITYTPISLATDRPPEPKLKIVRDALRSVIWICTKHTGSSFNQRSKATKQTCYGFNFCS